MFFNSKRDSLRHQSQWSGRPRERSSRLRFAPRPEVLEGRTLLSTITVGNTNDSGPGSLRQALANATDGSVIKFSPRLDGQTIDLTSGALPITKNLQIQGPGAGDLTISGGGTSGVFSITTSGLNVTISGLTIADGSAAAGAGISSAGGTLTVQNDTFTNDQAVAPSGGAGQGGAISSPSGALTVSGSTFSF